MNVYWLEQTKADLPAQADWMSADEVARLHGMRFEKRRNDWQLGRWTAKRALAAYWGLPGHLSDLSNIELRPSEYGAPEAFLANERAEVTVSLSHREGVALCAVARSGAELGCDLEIAEPRSDAFVSDYFTVEEQELVFQAHPSDRPTILAVLWSAKESALKALRIGLRLDTRSVAVDPMEIKNCLVDSEAHRTLELAQPSPWCPLLVCVGASKFSGWWQRSHGILRTIAAAPSPRQPIVLLRAK